MEKTIRAIYQHGQLQLLDPVNLTDGQQIELLIFSEREQARAALEDLLIESSRVNQDDIDEDALAWEIEEGFRGLKPLSETLIEERHEGP